MKFYLKLDFRGLFKALILNSSFLLINADDCISDISDVPQLLLIVYGVICTVLNLCVM